MVDGRSNNGRTRKNSLDDEAQVRKTFKIKKIYWDMLVALARMNKMDIGRFVCELMDSHPKISKSLPWLQNDARVFLHHD